jgi:hypothetical protein
MTSRPQSALKDLQHITEVDTDDALSGRGNLVAPGIDRLPWETVAKNGLDHISTSNMIWYETTLMMNRQFLLTKLLSI